VLTRHLGVRPFAALLAGALTISVAFPVAAAAPEQVTIVSYVTFAEEGEPNYGSFTTSGDAADSGTICPAGSFIDTGIRFAGGQSGRGEVQLQVYKTFTCDDGSGTFDVKMQIQANFETGIETFTWVVTGGTDDYASLRGGGDGSTVPREGGNINTYVGMIK
jgi:hypothetical protein